jgi:hypothetical protein
MNMKSLFGKFAAAALAAGIASGASASVVLTDLNSTVVLNNNLSAVDSWDVNGVSQLFEQTYFVRVGSTGGETELNENTLVNEAALGNIGSSAYAVGGLSITVSYTLTGTLGGGSDLAESIRITNTSGASINDIHFFQYVDFDLNGQIGPQSGFFENNQDVNQFGGGVIVSETVVAPQPNARALEPFSVIVTDLEDGSPTSLASFNNAPLANTDVTWAFEWIFSLGNNQSFLISKDKLLTVVPAPAALPAGLALLGLIAARRRRAA